MNLPATKLRGIRIEGIKFLQLLAYTQMLLIITLTRTEI